MKFFVMLFTLCVTTTFLGQNQIRINGEIYDTLNKRGVEHAVVMAVRVNDSVLQTYTRTDWQGKFSLQLPIDTFQILLTHPKFEEREYYVFGNDKTRDLNFGRIVLPPKGEELKEFVVFSNSEPIFFRGDTLVMVADSFKTAANANVEDLFKKLPGFDVDKTGKIVVHGKEVNKVYVDGDEFFGTDPTIATKNLPANAIENVEVYDQKVEGNNTDETEKVINLTLKESAKKGYFGKINGASDFQNFYEGEMLVNRFKGNQKVSVFGLFTNTPRSEFNWQDRYQYGLTEEFGNRDDDGNYIYEPQIGNLGEGLPQKAKTGFYFTDKIGKKLEIGTNFTYDNQQVLSVSETNTEFLLTDTTYSSYVKEENFETQEAMVFNVKLDWQLDSLTNLVISPRVKQINGTNTESSQTNFFSEEGFNSRNTSNSYSEETFYTEASIAAKFNRDFKKKDRNFKVNYQYRNQTNSGQDYLDNVDTDLLNSMTLGETHQLKNAKSLSQQHFGEAIFTEPLSDKFKIEAKYSLQYGFGNNKKYAFDDDGENYNLYNSLFSSNFENRTINQRLGGRLIFNSKKNEIIAGVDYNDVQIGSTDVLYGSEILKAQNKVLPYFKYKIKFSRSKNLFFLYKTQVSNPSISQLQPLPNNRNINNITVGNIDLVSQISKSFSVNYFSYKATTGAHSYSNAEYTIYEDAFSQSISYDDQGRAINQTINVSGNQRFFTYLGTSIPFLKQKFKFDPFVNFLYQTTSTEVNGIANTTTNTSAFVRGTVSYIMDSLEVSVGSDFNYGVGRTSLRPVDQKTVYQKYNAGIEWKLRHKIEIKTDVEYIINSQRAAGFDLNYTLWNASISKMFLTKENLIISLEAKDLLNQNISNSRSVYNNTVVDQKTNIIGRYLLLRAVYKFNVLKSNKDEDDLLKE